MDEYLKRSDLLAEYDRQHKGPPGRARRLIAEAPAAAVAPVVHGRWEHLEVGWFDLWRCSACGDEWTFGYDPTADDLKVKYCPNCGARMDG